MRILAVVSVLLLMFCGSARSLQEYALEDYCGSSISLKSTVFDTLSSGILKPRRYGSYTSDKSCVVTLTTNLLRTGIVVSVRKLDLRPDCKDVLKISYGLDSATFCNRNKFTSDLQIDTFEFKSYYYPGNIQISFNTGSGSTMAYDGFQLVVTATESIPCGTSSWEFRCDAPRCISKHLICDGHNHCGDRSDQYNCLGTPVAPLLGAIFGGIFLVLAIIGLIFYLRRKRRNVQTGTTVITTTHPPAPQPMYPTVQYPQYPPPYPPQGDGGVVNPSYR